MPLFTKSRAEILRIPLALKFSAGDLLLAVKVLNDGTSRRGYLELAGAFLVAHYK